MPLKMQPTGSSGALRLLGTKHFSDGYRFSDVVRRLFHAVGTSKLLAGAKTLILSSYLGEIICNRLEGEETKLEVEDAHMTVLGLTVRWTWTVTSIRKILQTDFVRGSVSLSPGLARTRTYSIVCASAGRCRRSAA